MGPTYMNKKAIRYCFCSFITKVFSGANNILKKISLFGGTSSSDPGMKLLDFEKIQIMGGVAISKFGSNDKR